MTLPSLTTFTGPCLGVVRSLLRLSRTNLAWYCSNFSGRLSMPFAASPSLSTASRSCLRAAASGVTSHATKCSSPFIASVTAKPWSGKYCTPRYAPVLSLGDSEVAGGPAPPALASVISATSHSSASAVSWCPSVSSTESSESFTFNDADALELEWGCTLALAGLALAALLPRGLLLAGRSPLVVLARDGLAAGRPTFRFRGGG
mmetsp:Transcript_10000/g.37825  ORF Transcript_10000/g.37825 Transcript_10000/m.37825 type:complete len:204 (+) Transcript_10000:2185-2796(+)